MPSNAFLFSPREDFSRRRSAGGRPFGCGRRAGQDRPGDIAVLIPSALRAFCVGRSEIRLAARNLRGLLGALRRSHPEVHRRVCDEQGRPRPHINVFVNEDHIRDLAGLRTRLKSGDVVAILPAVSGG